MVPRGLKFKTPKASHWNPMFLPVVATFVRQVMQVGYWSDMEMKSTAQPEDITVR
jgi:hypothetical protein